MLEVKYRMSLVKRFTFISIDTDWFVEAMVELVYSLVEKASV